MVPTATGKTGNFKKNGAFMTSQSFLAVPDEVHMKSQSNIYDITVTLTVSDEVHMKGH